jgi:hypothetical protein
MITDTFDAIAASIPEATDQGHPGAVADLAADLHDLETRLSPLAEVLSHPESWEALDALADRLEWLGAGHLGRDEVASIRRLIAALRVLR